MGWRGQQEPENELTAEKIQSEIHDRQIMCNISTSGGRNAGHALEVYKRVGYSAYVYISTSCGIETPFDAALRCKNASACIERVGVLVLS